MEKILKKPSTGGELLLQKKGPAYFRKLSVEGWKKRRAKKKQWELQQKKNTKKKVVTGKMKAQTKKS